MSPYLAPLRRFPWLVALAVPVSVLAGLLVVYEVQWGSQGPKLTERNQPTYQATVQVLVNSAANPYLSARESPASKALLDAANYLPFLIQSDRVAAIRAKEFGEIPGEITAQALFARETNRGLNASSIPIIEVTGFARTSRNSIRIAQGTVEAFVIWLTAEQEKSNLGAAGRILVEPLRSPTVTVDQRSSNGLAVLAFAVVLLGFVALAWVLDRVFPSAASLVPAGQGTTPGSGRERMLEPASAHGSAVVSVAGEPALSLDGHADGAPADGPPESTPIRPTEEPAPESGSRRRWA